MAFVRSSLSVLCVLLALGCKPEPRPTKVPSTFEAFPNLPLPPASQFVSRAGSEDALQLKLISAASSQQVLDYYRGVLTKGKWQLISDVKKPDGSVVLYAEQDGPPLWVTVSPTSDKEGTMIELSGAVLAPKPDSLAAGRTGVKAQSKPKPK
jgi:hypothetical protein